MKAKQFGFALLGLCLVSHLVSGQVVIQEPVFKHPDRSSVVFMLDFFVKNNVGKFDTLCQRSCCFVKFKLDEKGKIKEVKCTPTTPVTLALAFEKMVMATNYYWSPRKINGQAVESQYFVLPILYLFENIYAGCDVKDNCPDGIVNILNYNDEPYKRIPQELFDRSGETLDCIMLHPMLILSKMR